MVLTDSFNMFAAAVCHCAGKDGAEIRPADIETARANGKLEYELFAVLIHSGSAIGGHYYCYCRDGALHNDVYSSCDCYDDAGRG